jgi:carbon storage regulator
MLVISRMKNESIIIDEHVVVTVIDIRGDEVRPGIEAPGKYLCTAERCTVRS